MVKCGERIAELRERRGYSQEQLACILGISRPTLSHYELNRRQPNYDTLIKIADHFNVSVDYLMGRNLKEYKGKTLKMEGLQK